MRYLLSTLFLMAAALILPVPVAHAATETFVAFLNGANDGTNFAWNGIGDSNTGSDGPNAAGQCNL